MSGFADLPPLADDIEAGLAAYMTDPELSPSPAGRAAAIETILRDWLVAHSYMGAPPGSRPHSVRFRRCESRRSPVSRFYQIAP